MSADESRAELNRLFDDVRDDEELQREFQAVADDQDAWFALAHEKGYEIARDDVDDIVASSHELSDADLESVAGGAQQVDESWSLGCDTNTVNPTISCPD